MPCLSINFFIRLFYSGRLELLQAADKIIFNGLFLLLIIWKLSPIVFQFSTVIKNPLAVLYLPGGRTGFILAAVTTLIYVLLVMIKKEKEERRNLLKSLGLNLSILSLCAALLSAGTGLAADSFIKADPAASAVSPGINAPDFTLEAEDGNLYSLSNYTGKTVVLNFWASWCPPCRAEMPELINFYKGLDATAAFCYVFSILICFSNC